MSSEQNYRLRGEGKKVIDAYEKAKELILGGAIKARACEEVGITVGQYNHITKRRAYREKYAHIPPIGEKV